MTTYIPQFTLPSAIFESKTTSILLPIALGTAVGYSTRPKETKTTYLSIRQPPFHPPPYVFGPVWTCLYGLMGYAAYRALSPRSTSSSTTTIRTAASTLYTVQLALNLAWMPLFFGLKRPVLATADILALLGTNGYLTYLYAALDTTSAWCQAPYMAWLGFATYLCAGAGYLNGWDLSSMGGEEKKTA